MTAIDSFALRLARSRVRGATPEERIRDALSLRRAERGAAQASTGHMKFALLHGGDSEYALHKGTADYCRAMVKALRRVVTGDLDEIRYGRLIADMDRPTFTVDALKEAATTSGTAGIVALVRGDQ